MKLDDGWRYDMDPATGRRVQTKELTIHPAGEPRPALRYRLLPSEFDRLPGNAALYYLKATGFHEQEAARTEQRKFWSDAQAKAAAEGIEIDDLPPYVWLKTAPDQLPRDEVQKYLAFTSFQPHWLAEAARRDRFDMDRQIASVGDVYGYLLPEIQGLRELARNQSLRFRLALAEDRIDDALAILGQQFALARHVSQDEFLVSNLVGIAIAGIAWNDTLYLLQHPQAPNIYWAVATLPNPLADQKRALSGEREFLYLQIKALREVDETPRPAGYWQDFIDRLAQQIGSLNYELHAPSFEANPEAFRGMVTAYIAASYPGAKRFLLDELKLTAEQVEAYPVAQVVFLAMVRQHDRLCDDVFKWSYVPYWQTPGIRAGGEQAFPRGQGEPTQEQLRRYGWIGLPSQLLLPAISAVRNAEARCQQTLALIQTVEALRMYAAEHDGQLPASLEGLTLPAPLDPYTGRTISYERLSDSAILTGHPMPGMQYRLIVKVAE